METVRCVKRFANGAVLYAGGQDLLLCQHIVMAKPVTALSQQHVVTRVHWCHNDDGLRDGDYTDLPITSHIDAIRYAWQDDTIEVVFDV